MRFLFVWGYLLAVLIAPCTTDMYLHFPPGSNNRLNGNGVNVANAERLFDSQNNGKAGYNAGEKVNSASHDGLLKEGRQLPMEFYMSTCRKDAKTEVEIMWTNQHGTGPKTDDMVETQVILQYMCQDFPEGKFPGGKLDLEADVNRLFEYNTIRNGESTSTQSFSDGGREIDYVSKYLGLHEPLFYYQSYYRRERNKGLYTADQNLHGDKAIYTRQNAGGTRRGYEVAEERDYYPYWGPTPWRDIAIMVSDNKTYNWMKRYVNGPHYRYKYMCTMPSQLADNQDCPYDEDSLTAPRCIAKYISANECRAAGGTWTRFITNFIEKSNGILESCNDAHNGYKVARGLPYEPHLISQGSTDRAQYVVLQDPPEVIYAPSTVVNHNGMNLEGKFTSYKWRVPCFPTNTTQRCVLRIRYNITTDDVPRNFSAHDNDKGKNNPTTKAVDTKTDLQLALNTAQVGRTFQDRTHVFLLKPRSQLPAKYQHSNIYYIGGMGKRGNIVQAYPAMEYRFYPERISVTTDDIICFVWSGSNSNPSDYAGRGTAGTDRTNVCWVKEGCSSLKPRACSSLPLEVVNYLDEFNAHKLNLHLNKGCYVGDDSVQAELDNAPASCNPPCFRIKKPGEYCYMGTRNNNFSNRRHIGQITVSQASSVSA